MAKRRLTKGRMRPWACGHRGFGGFCHRCAQANELETRANALAQAVKNKSKTLPEFVEVLPEGLVIRAGGQRITTGTNANQETALSQIVTVMREHSTRLLKRTEGL